MMRRFAVLCTAGGRLAPPAFRGPSQPARGRLYLWALGLCAALAWVPAAAAQTTPEVREILERLDRVEAQNRALMAKIDALESELAKAHADSTNSSGPAAPSPTVEERLAVQEARTAEQAQTKVEASEKFPIRITGMALFNAYRNSDFSGDSAFPTAAAAGEANGGATFRQTVLGLDYSGPRTFWGGKVSGSLRMDFSGGSGSLLSQDFRLRTAAISLDWKSRGFRVALDKSILAVREPESLAQVSVPALTGAGNLWLWIPQARFEQSFRFTENSGLLVQAAAVQTNEAAPVYSGSLQYSTASSAYDVEAEPTRPGMEGRVEYFAGSGRRVEIAPGFHHSIAHAAGVSAPTDIYSLDWLVRPIPAFEVTGTVFRGTNTAALGGLRQGIVVLSPGAAHAVHSAGGWGQLTWRALPRVWFNFFTGQEDPRISDLPAGAISKSLAYGANVFFRIAPNVLTSFEAYQYRTSYVSAAALLVNHYDLALGYRF